MSSGRGGIHESGSQRLVLVSFFYDLLNLFISLYFKLLQPLNKDSHFQILSHFQSSTGSFLDRNEQILHLLVIDLEH